MSQKKRQKVNKWIKSGSNKSVSDMINNKHVTGLNSIPVSNIGFQWVFYVRSQNDFVNMI